MTQFDLTSSSELCCVIFLEIRFKAGTTFTLNSGVNHIQNFSCLKNTIRAENRSLYLTWKSDVLLSIDPSTIKFFNFQLH